MNLIKSIRITSIIGWAMLCLERGLLVNKVVIPNLRKELVKEIAKIFIPQSELYPIAVVL